MKTYYFIFIFLLFSTLSFSNTTFCPDAPINDDPCINSENPPMDLTGIGSGSATTCCSRGPNDTNTDGSPADFANLECSEATQDAAVWFMYTPDPSDEGYSITMETGVIEGPTSMEVYVGNLDAGCTGEFTLIEAICNQPIGTVKIGNCFGADDVIFVKAASGDPVDGCGEFFIYITPDGCETTADNCLDLADQEIILPITNSDFQIEYGCVSGCLEFACPEPAEDGGCPEFAEMPTVWFQVLADDLAAQMFTTVEANGNWTPIWSVYSGPDCDNLSLVDFGGVPPCSNGDNTPDLHQNSVLDFEPFYWIKVTATDVPSTGIDDGTFELCVATTVNAIICLGEEIGDCSDESLVIEVIERDNEDLSLDGPFCQGEEVTVAVSFFYDASESGADWLIGFVPMFGKGWDLEDFDFNANAPFGNGQIAQWYEEGNDLRPILQEDVPILCTYRDEEGVLQICNQLCDPCAECDEQGMMEGDPLPSGYFWVSNGSNAGCDNDGSPGEGWGIGSTTAQIDWTFTLRVKQFDTEEECIDKKDLSIGFQTFSDGVAGCWEDPAGECLLDRAMFGPVWTIGCDQVPPAVFANDIEICTKSVADIALNTVDGSTHTIFVKAVDNLFITGANDYEFDNGFGVITDFLVNNSDEDQIMKYEVYAVDPTLVCNGPKTIVEVLVYSQAINELDKIVCQCDAGCVSIGLEPLSYESFLWSTGESTNVILVCPQDPTSYAVTVTDANGCENYGSVLVDCEGVIEQCLEPELYKLVYDFFIDENENGIRDDGDNPFGEGSFFLEPDQKLIYNTSIEEDTLLVEEGDYTLTYIPSTTDDWVLTTDSIVTVFLDSTENCKKVEFGLKPNNLFREVELSHYLLRRCNSERTFYMYAKNEGTKIEKGTLWAELDEAILNDDFPNMATIDTFAEPNRIGWFFDNLLPGTTIVKEVGVDIPGPPEVEVGWVLNDKIYAELDNADGTKEIWGTQEYSNPILCGYDPNDKAVEPNHERGYTNIDEEHLIFKIRFQNTGNAPAENIEILDTLSEFLDINSIRYIAGSHDQYLTFSRSEERVLSFKFDNINLPDSTADLEGSQGFFIYKVDINEDVEIGTLIENTAHIYFDRNPAVVTNTTVNELYPDLDNDGFYSIEDCDEENESINPDAEEIPNNDVDENCDGVVLIIDNDMDGFNSDEDCNDEDPAINPDAEEVVNNSIDENCDNLVIIIDNDNDGFNSDEDCDDENATVNPDAEEIANNDIDEDCDGEALIIDNDEDGFNSDDDCDDEDAAINPDAEEVANNDVDEDCDGEALIIDNDNDGFNSDDDCDDEDAAVNPNAEEIANNDVDEDCDGEALIIDNDNDGFNSDDDCNDEDPDINPDAEDIPENGIDENCDGMDAIISSVNETLQNGVSIFPNPSNDAFTITFDHNEKVDYIILDVVGRQIDSGEFSNASSTIYLGEETNGLYLIVLRYKDSTEQTFHKLLKI